MGGVHFWFVWLSLLPSPRFCQVAQVLFLPGAASFEPGAGCLAQMGGEVWTRYAGDLAMGQNRCG